MNASAFIQTITTQFKQAANPEVAVGRAAYMKNKFIYFGITHPERKLIEAPLFKQFKPADEKELTVAVLALWDKKEREFQYCALQLISKHKKILTHDFISVAEQLVRTKSWWDTVDALASDLVGPLVLKFPHLAKQMDAWIEDEDFWIRRTAIIHQIMAKDKTDLKRLFTYCQKTMHEKEFFIRKAIGWALRQYSKTDPEPIRKFIAQHGTKLSGLSLREASKYV